MGLFKVLVYNFSVLISAVAMARASAAHCQIRVKYYFTTGANEVQTYQIPAKSKKDCQKKSALYKENTAPRKVDKKEVSVQWLGK